MPSADRVSGPNKVSIVPFSTSEANNKSNNLFTRIYRLLSCRRVAREGDWTRRATGADRRDLVKQVSEQEGRGAGRAVAELDASCRVPDQRRRTLAAGTTLLPADAAVGEATAGPLALTAAPGEEAAERTGGRDLGHHRRRRCTHRCPLRLVPLRRCCCRCRVSVGAGRRVARGHTLPISNRVAQSDACRLTLADVGGERGAVTVALAARADGGDALPNKRGSD